MRTFSIAILYLNLLVFHQAAYSAGDDEFENAANSEWAKTEIAVTAQYDEHEKRALQLWKDYKARIKQKWADGAIPEQKTYVQYLDSDSSRIKIDFEHGTVTVETLLNPNEKSKGTAIEKVQSALSTVIGDGKSTDSILAKDEVNVAAVTTEAMSEESTVAQDSKPRTLYRVTLLMVPDYIKKRAEKLKPIVEVWANKYKLDPAFILAIIRQESSFNPRARSYIPAFGLMQIVPKYAGQEVLKVVTGKSTLPDSDFLYTPEKNVMVGTTYLQLLRDQYFPDIKDEAKRMYLMTASYNWGPHRLKKAISQGRIPASANSSATFDIIQRIAPEETKAYVRKVSQYFIEFKKEGL